MRFDQLTQCVRIQQSKIPGQEKDWFRKCGQCRVQRAEWSGTGNPVGQQRQIGIGGLRGISHREKNLVPERARVSDDRPDNRPAIGPLQQQFVAAHALAFPTAEEDDFHRAALKSDLPPVFLSNRMLPISIVGSNDLHIS